jgi:glutathione peroxidase
MIVASLVLAVLGGMGLAMPAGAAPPECPPLLKHSFVPLEGGAPKSLCEYAGNVILVVNTASECGFTPQYEGLEALYKKFRSKGLVIVGFPSNDFGGQEPGSNKQIAQFCQANYGVSFPMFEKTVVSGKAANAFYAALGEATDSRPHWNFHKYLLDRNGTRVISYTALTGPGNSRLTREIERLLAEGAPAR